ncbi:unnamed protein product [Phyllotreta striolata]|uniref:CHK kinase-like domain-containing protein n=1 Tax=Phyllotreta striolata TaxID=444603 RepID=A0A9N9TZ01_PHYSR|nr:unnamed protein product [Phyllotreta striolata]
MVIQSEDIERWIGEIMKRKGIDNYELEVTESNSKGDGYSGQMRFVKVVTKEGKNNSVVYELVLKAGRESEKLREVCPMEDVYLREIHMYTEVFPAVEKLQREFNIKTSYKHYPKLFNFCKEDKKETLIFQNMKQIGYEVHERKQMQNLEHVLFVFRTYAKWHGASLALKIKKPELFHDLTKGMTDLMGDLLIESKMIDSIGDYFTKALNLLKRNGREEVAKKIEENCDVEKIVTKLTLSTDKDAEKEAVILHGDCWNNNMMFKYENNDLSKPIDMVLIDFQISRLASPILDLSYYLYAVADKSTLEKIDYLLGEYHKELGDYLKQYEIDVNRILTLQRLKESWKKYGRYGLVITPFITRVELCGDDEIIDFMDKIEDGSINDSASNISKQEEYDRRVLNVFVHFCDTFLA